MAVYGAVAVIRQRRDGALCPHLGVNPPKGLTRRWRQTGRAQSETEPAADAANSAESADSVCSVDSVPSLYFWMR